MPNPPYRDYDRAWTREICERYDFEGMRFDMTFWTCVCYCTHCRRRWQADNGADTHTVSTMQAARSQIEFSDRLLGSP